LWRLTLAEAAGINFCDLGYPEDLAAKLQCQIEQVFDTGQGLTDETPYASPTGVRGFYQYVFKPVFGAKGAVEAVTGSIRDHQTQTRRRRLACERGAFPHVVQFDERGFRDQEAILDATGRIVDYRFIERKPAFAQQTGLSSPHGRTVPELMPDMEPRTDEPPISSDGLAIGGTAGPYGRAAYNREPVYVSDIANDPYWADYRKLAAVLDLRLLVDIHFRQRWCRAGHLRDVLPSAALA
jgi:hypothetical protein